MNGLNYLTICLLLLALTCRPSQAKYETFSSYGRQIEVAPRGLNQNSYGTNGYGTNSGYGYGTNSYGNRNGPAEIDVKIVGTDYNKARRNRRMTDEVQNNELRG